MRKLGLNLGGCFLVALVLVALTLQGTPAFAQEVTATITGTITDQSGAAIAGATVTAKSVERGTTLYCHVQRVRSLPHLTVPDRQLRTSH